MPDRTYDATQHGFLTCALEQNHENRLVSFISGLRNDPQWSQADIDEIERAIRLMLGDEAAVFASYRKSWTSKV